MIEIVSMVSIGISITLSEKTLEKLDRFRGLVSRSGMIADILNKNLKKSGVQG